MRKFYVCVVVFFLCTIVANAQDYFWVGPSAANWGSAANWSSTSGGAGGFGVPNSTTANAIFDQNALVNVNFAGIALNTLTVTNNATATLYITAPLATSATITLHSTSAVTQALRIDAGARLEDSADVDKGFTIAFDDDSKGTVDGTWYFTGSSNVITTSNGATFSLPTTSGLTNRLDVNGSIIFKNFTFTPNPTTGQEYLFFNANSLFWLDRNSGGTPRANWNATSTIRITGITTSPPAINITALNTQVGNLVYDCPNLAVSPAGLVLPNNLIVQGNLQILNTNNSLLVLATNGSGILNNFNYTVNGNFDVSGNSQVAIGNASNSNKVVTFLVNGNVNAGGNVFDLQSANSPNVTANATTLQVKGNITHTAGTFTASSNATNAAVDLFVVELNGSSNQNISSTPGTIDNAANQLTLRLNNAAGATLTSPVAVGRLSFSSANKGILTTTGTNVLTINNTAITSLVVNSPGANAFVSGPVRRKTASTSIYIFPTGKGGVYHSADIIPSAATASTYEAEYFNAAYTDLTVASPLTGVTNLEYWTSNVISGTAARLQLSLNGTAVPGAVSTDGVAVGHYNGTDWAYASGTGTVITPGDATTGSTQSAQLALSGFFTFVFGPLGALPIQLISFDAHKISSGSALVNWEISSSSTPVRFEVLKSTDGRNFSIAGTVNAVDQLYTYSFTDNNLQSGTTYYRLKLIDRDGSAVLSKVVVVFNGNEGVLITALLPTIVRSTARLAVVSSQKGLMRIAITDIQGRVVKQQQLSIGTGNQEISLDLSGLASGGYHLTGYMNDQRVGTIRFIKQ